MKINASTTIAALTLAWLLYASREFLPVLVLVLAVVLPIWAAAGAISRHIFGDDRH